MTVGEGPSSYSGTQAANQIASSTAGGVASNSSATHKTTKM